MAVETWLLFVAVSILPAMSPGPAILLAISNALRFGPRSTHYSALGNSLGLTLLGLAVAFGLAALMQASAAVFTVVKIFGAAYLFYLGIKLWRSDKLLSVDSARAEPLKTPRALFLEALGLALTNPKGLLLLAALLPPFIDHTRPVVPQAAVMSVTFAVMCFLNHLFLAQVAGRIRKFLASERSMRLLRRGLGGMFIGFAGALMATSR